MLVSAKRIENENANGSQHQGKDDLSKIESQHVAG